MPRHRTALPQLGGGLFLTDGGLETTLIFHDGIDLPIFAAFDLLNTSKGEEALGRYYRQYAAIARRHRTGLVLESATWRANADWASLLGYDRESLEGVNLRAIKMLEEIRDELESGNGSGGAGGIRPGEIAISGCVGPRGDGYIIGDAMSEREAERYHAEQVVTFADSRADMVSAFTINYAEEGIGIVRAARKTGIPVVISFTVETDGNLPSGQPIGEAIGQVDVATAGYTSYYMINCAHPTHFDHLLTGGERWVERIGGLRANASRCSHAELDEAVELDRGNPDELGELYRQLIRKLPRLNVLGGCCGTDHKHIDKIAEMCAPAFGNGSE